MNRIAILLLAFALSLSVVSAVALVVSGPAVADPNCSTPNC
jgi:hypothetical protein